MRILYNDWPYGLDPAIVHIVVWTKFGCEEDPTTGDLTAKSRKQIDDYVTTTFRQHLKPDSVRSSEYPVDGGLIADVHR